MKTLTPFEEKTIKEFREKLEKSLDEGFPKIYEEGKKKRLNKRGEALALYTTAVLGLKEALREQRELIRKEVEKEIEELRLDGRVFYSKNPQEALEIVKQRFWRNVGCKIFGHRFIYSPEFCQRCCLSCGYYIQHISSFRLK